MKDKNTKPSKASDVIDHNEDTDAPGTALDRSDEATDGDDLGDDVVSDDIEMIDFKYKLKNGITVPLRAPKHRKDFPMEALLHTKRNDNIEFMFSVLTPASYQLLQMANATIEDFEGMCTAYGVATGAIEED